MSQCDKCGCGSGETCGCFCHTNAFDKDLPKCAPDEPGQDEYDQGFDDGFDAGYRAGWTEGISSPGNCNCALRSEATVSVNSVHASRDAKAQLIAALIAVGAFVAGVGSLVYAAVT